MNSFILGNREMKCPGELLFSPNTCECGYRRSMSFYKSGFVHWVNRANHKTTTTDNPTSIFQPTSPIPLGEARPSIQNSSDLTEITEQELRGPYNQSEFQIKNFGNPSPQADLPVSQFPVHGFGLFDQGTDSQSSHLESQSIQQLKPFLLAIQQSVKKNPHAQLPMQLPSELQNSRQESQTLFKDVITTAARPIIEMQHRTTTQPTTSPLKSTTASTQATTTGTPPTKARVEQTTTTTTEPTTSTTTQSTTMQAASTQPTTSPTTATTTTTTGTLPTRTPTDIRAKTTLYQITKETPSSQPQIDSVKIFQNPTQPIIGSQQLEQPTQITEQLGQTTQLSTEPVQTSQQTAQLSVQSAQTPQQTTQSVPQLPMQSVQVPQLSAQSVQLPQLSAQSVQVPQQTTQSVPRMSTQPVQVPQQPTISVQATQLLAQPVLVSQRPTQYEKASELPAQHMQVLQQPPKHVQTHQPLVQTPRNRQQSTNDWQRQSQTFYDQGNQPRDNYNRITNINNVPRQQQHHQQQQYLQNQQYQNNNNNFGLDPFIAYFLTS